MTQDTMSYDRFERTDCEYPAETFGLFPRVAAVQIEHKADRYCKDCATDLIGSKLIKRLKTENIGYDHGRPDTFGNITAVFTDHEVSCGTDRCGHCGIGLNVRVIHEQCSTDCPEA